MRHIAFVLAAALAAAPAAADGRLDTGFGQQGFVVEGFQPHGGGGDLADSDIGLVACAGPLGSLVVSGLASEATRVVTMWLTPSGTLDTRFSDDGKASFALPAGRKDTAVGLCQPDGKPVIAYDNDPGGTPDALDDVIHLVRIDPANGLADPSFGGGRVTLDLAVRDSSTARQTPVSLTAGVGGDLLLTGRWNHQADGETHGFIARITGSGGIAALNTSRDGFRMLSFATAGVGADGRVRAIGNTVAEDGNRAALGRVLFDYATLEARESGRHPAPGAFRVWGGRMLPGGTMAVAAWRDGLPVLLLAPDVFDQWRIVALPRANVGGQPALAGLMQVAGTADGGVLVAHGAAAPGSYPSAVQFTKVRGSADGGVELDPRFGQAGNTVVRRAPVAGCGGGEVLAFARFTYWNGAPTAVGVVDSDCGNGSFDFDYAVFRLQDELFADEFETRHAVR